MTTDKENLNNIVNTMTDKLNSQSPYLINRFGGSDFSALVYFFNNNNNISEDKIDFIRKYNGYFNFKNICTDNEIFAKMTYAYSSSFKNSDIILDTVHNLSKTKHKIVDEINKNDACIIGNYNELIESFVPFMDSFKNWGNNKKILIISPFEETIKFQTNNDRINKIINNYTFPNCTFLTYQTPITYNSNHYDFDEYFFKVTEGFDNWIELVQKICDDISCIDFDIAFLSCGIYSYHVGDFIKTKLNKKSIYIGGMLNVMFNFYGKRYDTPFFNKFMNMNYQVNVMDDYIDLYKNNNKNVEGDALNAYYGKK